MDTKIIAYASSTRLNHLWSAAQFNSALPKNREDADTPLVAKADYDSLLSERNLYKGKYRALLKLISRTSDKLVHVTDHIEDDGDRRYFGSTNDADALRDIYDEMMSWVWDAVDKVNRMKSDPYADIREQRSRAEKAEAEAARYRKALSEILGYDRNFYDNGRPGYEAIARDALNGGSDA